MVPNPITRPREGRWLGGVCAGLARRWEVTPASVRLWFVLGTLLLGLGVLVYVAAWLIFPSESEEGRGQRGIVLLAQACGALIGIATLGGAGAAATIFGYGWVIVALAGAILIGTLAGWARLGPAWALLPIGALVLPSAAFAVSGVRIEPTLDAVTVAPKNVADLEDYTSGLNTLTIDLRRTEIPDEGFELRIDAGVRRTLVALPHERCVHVNVTQHEPPPILKIGAALVGEGNLQSRAPMIFGRYGAYRDHSPFGTTFSANEDTRGPGPTINIDYSTMGAELIVRDYPDSVDPRYSPDWPGYMTVVEERPDTSYLSPAESRRILRAWRKRRADQRADMKRIQQLMSGPCAQPVKKKKDER